jgi:ABC-type branched-subunit amino acid transport system ATPase component
MRLRDIRGPPAGGRILLEGKDITGLKPHQRAARGLARTFQIPHEFSQLTVIENFMAAAATPIGENVFNVIFRRGRFAAEEERDIPRGARDGPPFSRSTMSRTRRLATCRAARRNCSNSAAR